MLSRMIRSSSYLLVLGGALLVLSACSKDTVNEIQKDVEKVIQKDVAKDIQAEFDDPKSPEVRRAKIQVREFKDGTLFLTSEKEIDFGTMESKVKAEVVAYKHKEVKNIEWVDSLKPNGEAKSDVRNLAMAAESYYATNNFYPATVTPISTAAVSADFRGVGFRSTENVTVSFTNATTTFTILGYHVGGTKTFTWNLASGGMQ